VSIDQQFVEFVIKSLVTKPEAVQIERRIDEKGVLLELTVDPEDLGRVIGKRGATAQSVRTLLRALGTKNDARYNLKIVDNGVGSTASGTAAAASTDDASASDDSWSQSDTGSSNSAAATEEELVPADEPESDVVAKTRRELRDLDDLDV
jgi:predicted RNA-binding protein YlqC (UPF0109 family)